MFRQENSIDIFIFRSFSVNILKGVIEIELKYLYFKNYLLLIPKIFQIKPILHNLYFCNTKKKLKSINLHNTITFYLILILYKNNNITKKKKTKSIGSIHII